MISRVNHHQKMSPGKCLAGDIFLMILLVAADQVAKWLSYLYLKGQLLISLIPGVLELHYLYHCECTVSGSDPLCMDPYSKRAFLSAAAYNCHSTCCRCSGEFY